MHLTPLKFSLLVDLIIHFQLNRIPNENTYGYLILDFNINDQKFSFIAHSFIIVYQIDHQDPQLKLWLFYLVVPVVISHQLAKT